MKLMVTGIGGVGGYVASVLCAAYSDVTLIARGPAQRSAAEKGPRPPQRRIRRAYGLSRRDRRPVDSWHTRHDICLRKKLLPCRRADGNSSLCRPAYRRRLDFTLR